MCIQSEDTRLSGYGSHGEGCITGLFVDPTTSRVAALKTLGITRKFTEEGHGNELFAPDKVQLSTCRPGRLYFSTQNRERAFLSKAVLRDVKALEVQRRGDHCRGLCILHQDGHREALGGWDPSDQHAIQTIYEAGQDVDALASLTFMFTEGLRSYMRHVQDIYVGSGCPGTPVTVRWTDMNSVRISTWMEELTQPLLWTEANMVQGTCLVVYRAI